MADKDFHPAGIDLFLITHEKLSPGQYNIFETDLKLFTIFNVLPVYVLEDEWPKKPGSPKNYAIVNMPAAK
jgi:hypothetical protein